MPKKVRSLANKIGMSSSTVILYKSPHPRKPVTHQGSMILRRAVPSIAHANGERVCIIFRDLEHAGRGQDKTISYLYSTRHETHQGFEMRVSGNVSVS